MDWRQVIFFLRNRKYTKDMIDPWDVMTPDELMEKEDEKNED